MNRTAFVLTMAFLLSGTALGDSAGYVHYYENIGSATVPQLTDRGRLQDGSGLLTVQSLAMPVINDWDDDGRKDLVVGAGPDQSVVNGPVRVYRYLDAELTQWFSLDAYPGLTHGTCVATGRF